MSLGLIVAIGENAVTATFGLLSVYFGYKFITRVISSKSTHDCSRNPDCQVTESDVMLEEEEEEEENEISIE